ncbi:MAG: hypothetical protein JWP03_2900 [Phycisphaerales bacterium]|nr:hypothetical protein [Phycisphaerales bacterium]
MKHFTCGVLRGSEASRGGSCAGGGGECKKTQMWCVLVQRMRRARAELSAGGEDREAILAAIFNKLEREDSEPIGMKRA